MNTKRFSEAMGEIDNRYVVEAMSYDMSRPLIKKRSPKRTLLLAAALIAALALSGFAAFELGLFDRWFQNPSTDPVKTVQSALEGQIDKEYTINLRIEEISIDDAQAEKFKQQYKGSEWAALNGWSEEYIENHFIVVKAYYYVEYDHTKTFLDDGYTVQYFYLAEDIESGRWKIIDNSGSFSLDE